METIRRYLEPSEAKFYASNEACDESGRTRGAAPRWTVEYRGNLDVSALKQAVQVLFDRHTVLGSHIRKDDRGYLLEMSNPEDHPNLIVVDFNGDRSAYLSEAKKIHENWHSYWGDNALAHIALFHCRSRGYVLFAVEHAIVDVASLKVYFAELWQLYTAIVEGREISSDGKRGLPKPPSEVFKERYGEDFTEKSNAHSSEKSKLPLSNEITRPEKSIGLHEKNIQLSPTQTAHLVSSARTQGTTVGMTLAATMAITLCSQEPKTGPVPVVFLVAIDRRKGGKSAAVSGETTTFGVTTSIITIDVAADAGIATVANALGARVNDEMTHPTRQTPSTTDIDVCLNNGGVFPDFAHPEDLDLVDLFHPVMYPAGRADNSNWTSGPRPRFSLECYTFNGMLKLHVRLRADIDKSVIDDFATRLRTMTEMVT